jgi:hypothetical protein
MHPRQFFKYVKPKLYADDNVTAVARDIKGSFNGKTLCEWARRLGITLTSSNKEGDPESFVPLTEARYLKRGFVPMDGIVHAPLPMEVLTDSLQYVYTSEVPVKDIMRDKLRQFVLNSSHYGKAIYEVNRRKALDMARDCGVTEHYPDFGEALVRRVTLDYFLQ